LLTVNTIIEWKYETKVKYERILWMDYLNDIVYVINVNDNNLPIIRKISEIDEQLKSNKVFIENNDPFFRIQEEEKLTDKDIYMREEAWNYIKDIIKSEPDIYQSKLRSKLISEISNKENVHRNSIVKYIKRYWKRGMCKNALLPDYSMCGGLGKERAVDKLKRGRPRIYVSGEGTNINEDIKKIFRIAINKYYNNASKKSLVIVYECMIKEYFNQGYYFENGTKNNILYDSNNLPTVGQFKYWFYKERNLKKEVTSRISNKKYLQVNRAILGNSTTQTIGPGESFQVDANISDIYLCSTFDRNQIIGRPIVYFLVDTFSRMIAGIYVGLEGPSWLGASMAIVNTASNKKEFCEEYGILIENDEWPVNNIPDTILADRGEFEGYCAENLINSLGIKVQNTPPYRADFKGIVEQYFNILNNQRIKPFLPGTIDANGKERGDKDYRLDAKLNINEFTQVVIRCVLYNNNHHYINNYPKDDSMLKDNVKSIPIQLWNWGIKNRSGKLRTVDLNILKLNLMPKGVATVTAKGVLFKQIYYTSSVLMKDNSFEKARKNGTWKINIVYDPRNLNFIYLKDDKGRTFEKLTLIEYQHKYKNKCIEEVNYINELEKLEKEGVKSDKLQEKVNLISEIDSIVEKAKGSYNSETYVNDSKRSRLNGIRENRDLEKQKNRKEEAFELKVEEKKNHGQVISLNNEELDDCNNVNEIEMLRRKQKERLRGNNDR